jgi:hypothetical protein
MPPAPGLNRVDSVDGSSLEVTLTGPEEGTVGLAVKIHEKIMSTKGLKRDFETHD